jgi:hypothetical protein
VRRRGQFDIDPIARVNLTAGQYYAHDSGFANDIALVVVTYKPLEKAGLKLIQLDAGVSQTGHLNHCRITHVQPGAFWEGKKIDATGCHILAQLSGGNFESGVAKLSVQFEMNQVYLAQVRLAGVNGHS